MRKDPCAGGARTSRVDDGWGCLGGGHLGMVGPMRPLLYLIMFLGLTLVGGCGDERSDRSGEPAGNEAGTTEGGGGATGMRSTSSSNLAGLRDGEVCTRACWLERRIGEPAHQGEGETE